MDYLLRILENKNIKNHSLGIFGSYNWSGGALARLEEFAENVNYEPVRPAVEVKCAPTDEDFEQSAQLAKDLATQLK
jgi:flavorubredoxin